MLCYTDHNTAKKFGFTVHQTKIVRFKEIKHPLAFHYIFTNPWFLFALGFTTVCINNFKGHMATFQCLLVEGDLWCTSGQYFKHVQARSRFEGYLPDMKQFGTLDGISTYKNGDLNSMK